MYSEKVSLKIQLTRIYWVGAAGRRFFMDVWGMMDMRVGGASWTFFMGGWGVGGGILCVSRGGHSF